MKNNRHLSVFALFLPEIKEFLQSKNFAELKELLKKLHAMDLAEGLKVLEPNERLLVFKLLGTRKAIEVFEYLPFDDQSFLLNNLASADASQLLNEMAADERAKLFKDLPEKVVKKLFSLMKKEEVEDVRKLLTYKEGTAGSIMTTEFVELRRDMTARQAILTLQQERRIGQREDIYSVYVTDKEHKLLGGLSLQALITAAPDAYVRELMSPVELIKVHADMVQADVSAWFKKYNLTDAPVVDEEGRLLGIITVDDVVDVIERQATKEIYEIGKMSSKKGEVITYADAKVLDLIKRRAGWLVLLLVFDFLTGTVLKAFEHALGTVVALSFFIPMLLGTGGNAGTQTFITIIRGLATGDITLKSVWRVIRLEVYTALFMGAIVGVVAFGRAWFLEQEVLISLVVGVTMMLIVFLAIGTGIALPLISKKCGLDPAVLAGPITTSVVDIVGLIIYFKIAQLFLPILKH